MEIVGNVIGCIIWGLWIVLIFVNMYSNHKNEKSNAELMREIHKSNELNKRSMKFKNIMIQQTKRPQLKTMFCGSALSF